METVTTMSPAFALALMMNNYLHDVATALLLASGVTTWVVARSYALLSGAESARLYLAIHRAMTRLALFSLAWIVLGGIPRTIFYEEFEWANAAGRGQVPVLVAKHVVAFALLAAGVAAWWRVERRARALRAALQNGTGLLAALVAACLLAPAPVWAELPVIDAVTAPVEVVLTGEIVALAVEAHDPAGGPLAYAWTATGGTLAPAGATATWTAPAAAGAFTVTATVTNALGGAASAPIPLRSVVARSEGALAPLGAPQRVTAAPDGTLYVVDARDGGVVVLTARGERMGTFTLPERAVSVAVAPAGLLVATTAGNLLTVDRANGRVIGSLALGTPSGPAALAYDVAGQQLWLADRDLGAVRAIRLDGSLVKRITMASTTALVAPSALAVDASSGVLWVAQESNEKTNAVHAFTREGTWIRSAVPFGAGTGRVTRVGGIALDGVGRVYVSDMFQGQVQVISTGGAALGTLGAFGDGAGQLSQPSDVTVLANGDLVALVLDGGRTERFGRGVPLPVCEGDADCDGLPDVWETTHGSDPTNPLGGFLDADGDGLNAIEESQLGTDPLLADSDSDGVSDDEELATGFDPRDPTDHVQVSLVTSAPLPDGPGLVRLTATVASSQPCEVGWTQTGGPAVALRGATTLTPTFVARIAGAYAFRATATCGPVTATSDATATIDNVSPHADAGRIAVVAVGAPVALDGTWSSDGNGGALALRWDQTLGPAIVPSTEGAAVAFVVDAATLLELALTARDGGGAEDARLVEVLAVDPARPPPEAIAFAEPSAAVGEMVHLDASASVVASGAGAYAWTQVAGPSVAVANPSAPVASFVPTAPGRYAFELRVTDGELAAPVTGVEVRVSSDGALPRAIASAPATANVGDALTLDASASAPAHDGAALTTRWRQASGPAAGLRDRDTARASVVAFAPGVHEFEVTAIEDGAESEPARVRVTVSAPGAGVPLARATGPGAAEAGAIVRLDGSGSGDPEGDPLRFRWTQVSGPWVPLLDRATASPWFVPIQPGVYVFELEVDDGAVRSAPGQVAVLVTTPPSSSDPTHPEPPRMPDHARPWWRRLQAEPRLAPAAEVQR